MRLWPRTMLVRVFLLVGALIVVTVGTWLVLFQAAEREPRARQLAQLVTSIANMTRSALVHADPANRIDLIRELSESEGLHLFPADDGDRIEALPHTSFHDLYTSEVRRTLGSRTRIARSVNGQPGLWTSFWIGEGQDADEYWIVLPEARIDPGIALHWIGWGVIVVLLVLLVAAVIALRITRPLKQIALAARAVGRGLTPAPLPERGAEELVEVAAAFNRMSQDLARVEAERAEVLAGISHDLRTPIARLRLDVEMSVPDDSSRQAMIDDLEQMEAIIGQFLDYARGTEGEAPSALDACDLVAVVAGRRVEHGEEITATCAGPLPLHGHRTALLRAIENLVENARKYAGGRIELAATAVADRCLIEVRDRGPGIPPEEIERLKRPFTRLERARSNVKGTGLGLAIIERIARAHGGRFELAARDGGGLIARLDLPLAAVRQSNSA